MPLHRFMVRAAFAGSQVFAWLFIFQLSLLRTGSVRQALVSLVLLYALSQITAILLAPFAARVLGSGMLRMMAYGTLALAATFVCWGAAFSGFAADYRDVALVSGAIFLGCFHALYIVPYVFARPAWNASITVEMIVALMPAVTGILLARTPLYPSELLFVAAGVALVSLPWLIGSREVYERFAWGYRETFGELFEPRKRRLVTRAFRRGVESAALFLLWPIAIFMILRSYAMLGLIVALMLVSFAVARAFRERFASRKDMPLSHGAVAASAWIVRLFPLEPISIVLVNAYGAFGDSVRVSDVSGHEHAENSTYLDEHTTLKEMAYAAGRLTCALLAAFFAAIFSAETAFIAAFALVALVAGFSAYANHARA